MELRTQLKVLISSKQLEFTEERSSIIRIMERMPLLAPDAAEHWPARREGVEHVSVRQAADCAIYVGLFGCLHSDPTILEFEAARKNRYRQMLIYIRKCPKRSIDPKLAEFLDVVQHPKDGCTVVHYHSWDKDVRKRFAEHLWHAVALMVRHLLSLSNPEGALGPGGTSGASGRQWARLRALDGLDFRDLGLPANPAVAARMAAELQAQLNAVITSGEPSS